MPTARRASPTSPRQAIRICDTGPWGSAPSRRGRKGSPPGGRWRTSRRSDQQLSRSLRCFRDVPACRQPLEAARRRVRYLREWHRGKQGVGDRCGSAFAVERHTRLRLRGRISSACPTTSDQHREDGAAQAQPRHPRPTTLCGPGLSHVHTETTPEQRGPSQLGDSANAWKPEPVNADARSRSLRRPLSLVTACRRRR
jgi:hypothetical protein